MAYQFCDLSSCVDYSMPKQNGHMFILKQNMIKRDAVIFVCSLIIPRTVKDVIEC